MPLRNSVFRCLTQHAPLNPKVAQTLEHLTQQANTGYLRLGKTHLQRMLVISAVLHGILLMVRFIPEDFLKRWDKEALQVVLVNAAGEVVPTEAQAFANANLRGSGEADEGIVKSPLPNLEATQHGDDLAALQKQVSNLEAQQASLLSAIKGKTDLHASTGTAQQYNPKEGKTTDSNSTQLLREVAALDKQIQDYNKRPKRAQISPATSEAAFATYYALWSDRTERLGTEYYPEAAKGKSAEVIVTVSIRADGSLEDLVLERSSGNKAIDRGALRLLKRLAPYPRFQGTLKQNIDVLDITTKLVFTPANTFTAQMQSPLPAVAPPAILKK